MTGERFLEYSKKLEKRKHDAEHLQRMAQRLYEVSDDKLTIYNRMAELCPTNQFGMVVDECISWSLLEKIYPELRGDEAFERINKVYKKLESFRLLNWKLPLACLEELVKEIANREMNQLDYEDVTNGKFNIQIETEEMLAKLEKSSEKVAV